MLWCYDATFKEITKLIIRTYNCLIKTTFLRHKLKYFPFIQIVQWYVHTDYKFTEYYLLLNK